MCDPVSATIAAVSAVAGGVGYSQQRKAQKAQNRAQAENLLAQQKTLADGQKAEANARRQPNFSAIFDKNTIASGVGSTMLTGAGGVTNGLSLGKNSLLGGGA